MAWFWVSWRRRLSILWLLVSLLCMVWAGKQLFAGQPLETNLLALLPPTERNPKAETAVNQLSEILGNRAVFLIGHTDPDIAHRLARQFAESLRASSAFKQILDQAPNVDASLVLDFYRPFRSGLLTDADRSAIALQRLDPAARLARRVYQPFSGGLTTPLAEDPLGIWQQWLANLPLNQSLLSVEDGQLVARDHDKTWVLILADPAGSAYDQQTQNRVLEAFANARAAIAAGKAEILHTGGVFYGAAARSKAESEVDLIGAGSLIGILLMMAWLFRSLRPLALSMLTVAIGLACALTATIAVFGQLHLITLVFGASLIGEAVDYAIQYFAAQLEAGEQWEPVSGLQRVLRGLSVALATSLIGYGALALSPFPAIGQIALFAFAGLAGAWLSVILLLPYVTRKPTRRDANAATRIPRAILVWWRQHMNVRRGTILVLLILLIAIPGWLRLKGNDDIRLLVDRPAALQSEETQIRALTGFSGNSRFYLVEGNSWEQLLQSEERLTSRLIASGMKAPLAVSRFVPSQTLQQENRKIYRSLFSNPQGVEKDLSDSGFRADLAHRWVTDMADSAQPVTPAHWLASPLSRPYQYLVISTDPKPATVVIPQSEIEAPRFEELANELPGVTAVDKAASVSALFHRYRVGAAWWLPIAIVIVAGVLILRYGRRNGLAVLLPTLLAMGLALALYGYTGQPLTLFSLMGLMLVLGVGANYAVFLFEAGDRAPAPFAGVLLSAATTMLSFGLLALSSMPALQHFGAMLLAGISASVLFAPLALTFGKPQ